MNEKMVNMMEKEMENLLEVLKGLEPGSTEYDGIIASINKLYETVNKEKEVGLAEDRLKLDEVKIANDKELKYSQLTSDLTREKLVLINNREQRSADRVNNNLDRELKGADLKSANIQNVLKQGVEIAAIVVPVVFYGVWMKRGFKFEEEGTFTSNTFKGLISKFKPTR